MLVRTGSTTAELTAAPFADVFLQYALLADQTYADEAYNTPFDFTLREGKYCHPVGSPSCVDLTPLAESLLHQWRLIFASKNPADFPCAPARPRCTKPLPGLGVQVWMRREVNGVCPEAVVAFRGTDRENSDDWTSNLRWLLRFMPLYDQYDQVQDHAPDFVAAIERQPCFVRGRTRITAVGHSLGGGLAQQAAFMDPRIRQVYAFDSSIVTGSTDRHVQKTWDRNVPGLKIEHVYEHGEILAYLRFLQRQFAPPSACNPQVRSIRFQAMRGSSTQQHKLSAMVTNLLYSAGSTPGAAKSYDLPGPAPADCPAPPRDGAQETLVVSRNAPPSATE